MPDCYTPFPHSHSDGSPVFLTERNTQAEREIADTLARAWKCELHHFGALCPVDFYALRDGRLVGIVEARERSIASDTFSEVFLSVRKWLALLLASTGLGCPGIFVVRFTDSIRFINVDDIDACKTRAGWKRAAGKGAGSTGPVILIPVEHMTRISEDP